MYISPHIRRKAVLVGLGVAVCSLALVAYYVLQRSGQQPPPTSTNTPLNQVENNPEAPSIGSPVRIIIPRIKVNAILEYVGLTPDGEMGEPTEAANAAWFNRRPLPGEEGTSVIAGHFGLKNNKPAVFDDLDKLRKGDELHVQDSNGTLTIFIVRELRTYTSEQDATEVFSSTDEKSHLNLITCQGAWVESLQSYDTRLVVFADKQPETNP